MTQLPVGPQQSLAPLAALAGYTLDGESAATLARARERVVEAGGGPLTTSFILLALVERAGADGAHPLHFLAPLLLEPDPYAYRGVAAAYVAWYSGANRPAEGRPPRPAAVSGLSPYVLGALDLAAELARATSNRGAITAHHLLAALLRHQPQEGDGVQQGAQYLLSQCPPGVEVLLAALRQTLGPAQPPAWQRLLAPIA